MSRDRTSNWGRARKEIGEMQPSENNASSKKKLVERTMTQSSSIAAGILKPTPAQQHELRSAPGEWYEDMVRRAENPTFVPELRSIVPRRGGACHPPHRRRPRRRLHLPPHRVRLRVPTDGLDPPWATKPGRALQLPEAQPPLLSVAPGLRQIARQPSIYRACGLRRPPRGGAPGGCRLNRGLGGVAGQGCIGADQQVHPRLRDGDGWRLHGLPGGRRRNR